MHVTRAGELVHLCRADASYSPLGRVDTDAPLIGARWSRQSSICVHVLRAPEYGKVPIVS